MGPPATNMGNGNAYYGNEKAAMKAAFQGGLLQEGNVAAWQVLLSARGLTSSLNYFRITPLQRGMQI
jgi:hypothetical protein